MKGSIILLFTDNLDQKIFSTHLHVNCDELFIISGYVGPNPIQKLSTLPIKTTVIYGMYGSDSISYKLHNTLVNLHNTTKTEILYSKTPVHAKCYIWRKNGDITYALIGSANFSTNGLTTPYREALAETATDTFQDLNSYLNLILSKCVLCNTVTINPVVNPTSPRFAMGSAVIPSITVSNSTCSMVLYDPQKNEVATSSGLNWGHSAGHTNSGDAYITIRASYIRSYPNLFPPKQTHPTKSIGGRPQRQNDYVELIWDDGKIMNALLEGTQTISSLSYPKQLSSSPSKNILGLYIRNRLGLSPTALVTKADLDNYGRDYIDISLLQNGTYYVDFSV